MKYLRYINEDDEFENDTSIYTDCLESLRKVNSGISRQEVLKWFNDNDIEYLHMSDIDMYIKYIVENSYLK